MYTLIREVKKMPSRWCPHCHARMEYVETRSKFKDANGREYVDKSVWQCPNCGKAWMHSVVTNSWEELWLPPKEIINEKG